MRLSRWLFLSVVIVSVAASGCDRFADDDLLGDLPQTTLRVIVEPASTVTVGDTLRLEAVPADGTAEQYAYRWNVGDAPGRFLNVGGTPRGSRIDFATASRDDRAVYALAFTVTADDSTSDRPPAQHFFSVNVRADG